MDFKKYLTPVNTAVVLAVLLALWLAIGEKKSALNDEPAEQKELANSITQVEVYSSQARYYSHEVVAQGQIVPWHQVKVTAQVSGQVEKILKRQGDHVQAGEALLRLSNEGRSERLAQAQATLKLRERELANAQTLEKSKFVAETEISRLESALAEARAKLVEEQLAVQYSNPAAPFKGVVNRRHVDPGEWVGVGTALMDIVDVSRLRATAFVPQQQVSELKVGQNVKLELLDGRLMQGTIHFVSNSADLQTRSYYIEVATANPEHWRIAGASATLRIELPQVMAHRFSPALLSLNERGQLGVQAVNDQSQVQFYPVKTLNVDTKAATVAGLPDALRLITLGAGFVQSGQTVQAVEAEK